MQRDAPRKDDACPRRSDARSDPLASHHLTPRQSPPTPAKALPAYHKPRRNLAGLYHYTGVGVARSDSTGAYYYTHLFVR